MFVKGTTRAGFSGRALGSWARGWKNPQTLRGGAGRRIMRGREQGQRNAARSGGGGSSQQEKTKAEGRMQRTA